MSVVAVIKGKSSMFNKVQSLSVESFAELVNETLIISKFSAIDHNEFKGYEETSIPLSNFGQIYVGVEKQSSRGIGLFYDENKDQYEIKLNQPCNVHDRDLFKNTVKALSLYTGHNISYVNGSADEVEDILVHWNNLIHYQFDNNENIAIQGLNLEIWMDRDFLNNFKSGHELLDYFVMNQWHNDDFVASAQFLRPKKDFGLGLWVNTRDLTTVYPISPVVPSYLKIDPSIVTWIIMFSGPETEGLPSQYVEYKKFVEYMDINESNKVGVNHFRTTINDQIVNDILNRHGKLVSELMK